MRIKKLIFENFLPFYGRQIIDLSTIDGRPVVLVRAPNDVGKTSLFKAIQFCLYGVKPSEIPKHINRSAAKERDGRALVKLQFDHEEKFYEITRSIYYHKALQDDFPVVKNVDLEVVKEGKPVSLPTRRQQDEYIEAVLPKDASQFFLFDGEDIQKYTRHPPSERVKEAIEIVLGIRELLYAREDLESIKVELKRELDRLLVERSKHDVEAVEVERIGKEIDDLKRRIIDLEDKILQAQETRKECDWTLMKHQAIQAKIEQRKQAEGNCELLNQQIESNKNEQQEFNRNLGILLIEPLLTEISMMSKPRVPHWKRTAISVLNQKPLGFPCVCGKSIDSSAREHFEKALAKLNTRSSLDIPSGEATELLDKTQPALLKEQLYTLARARANLEENLALQKQTIEDLNKEIGGQADISGDIKAAEDLRSRANYELDVYRSERSDKLIELGKMTSEYNRRQAKLVGRLQTDKDVENKSAHLKSCEQCLDAVKYSIDKLVYDNKNKVEKLASQNFMSLTNAPKLYRGIRITDEYELRIETIGGTVRDVWNQAPSAGQSQIIAFSFIAALNKYTARDAPIIIDTPIGRLDPTHKENIIDFYPQIGPQLVVLYQPSELKPEDVVPIQKYISSEWEMIRDPDDPDATLIKSGVRHESLR